MPKSAKKTHSSSNSGKKEIPPDVFDDTKGVKVFIPDEELMQNEKVKIKNEKEHGEIEDEAGSEEKEPDEKFSEEAKPKEAKTEVKDSEDKIEVSVKIEKKNSGEKEKIDEKNSEVESGSVADDEKEEDEEAEESDEDYGKEEGGEQSFYEKVLGQKPPDDPSEDSEEKEGINRSLFFLGGIVFVMTILIATGVGLILLNKSNVLPKINLSIKPTAVPTKAPTPTPLELKKSDISFEVLNGSGVSGAAGKAGDKIKAFGYSVDKVDNADSSGHTGIEVSFSPSIKDDTKNVILKDLKSEFSDVSENSASSPDGTADVLVVVGK